MFFLINSFISIFICLLVFWSNVRVNLLRRLMIMFTCMIWLQKVRKQVESNKMYRITICFFCPLYSVLCHANHAECVAGRVTKGLFAGESWIACINAVHLDSASGL